MRPILLCVLLAGCAHAVPPTAKVVVVRPVVHAKIQAPDLNVSPETKRLIRAYRRAERLVPKTIAHPGASLHDADEVDGKLMAAHEAVQKVIDQGHKPTPEALKAAGEATDELLRAQRRDSFGGERWPGAGPSSK